MVGTQISHYTILAALGQGGMGVVYRAEDTRLGREVALKFLSDDLSHDRQAIERFQREARAASGLNHPHVCAVYDIGEHQGRHFIVMELLDGVTLHDALAGGALPVERILDIGIQISDALAAAHALGIVHRDIKPANVFVTTRGSAKLLDFGLARATVAEADGAGSSRSAGPTLEALTSHGVVLGTIAYMSPEQVRGEPLDARTDLFSLGAVLYEMATGRQAFTGATAGTIYDAILNRAPADASTLNSRLPAALAGILQKALEKDRARRYQDAAALRSDLRAARRELEGGAVLAAPSPGGRRVARAWWHRPATLLGSIVAVVALLVAAARLVTSPGRAQAIDSVAVLPFANANNSADGEYLSDGITENLIRDLSQLPSLRVTARSRVFRYRGKEVDPQAVGRELNVRAVLSGRLLQRGDTLVVRTELMDVLDGSQLWGGEYTSTIRDIFEVQSYLSGAISEKLRLRLTPEQRQRLKKRPTADNDAYRLYLQGRYQWNKRSRDAALKAITYYTQAIDRDPTFALAYAALADAYSFASFSNAFPPREAMPKAEAAARHALEVDPSLADAHISLGYASFTYEWDWAAATNHFDQARALDPAAVDSHPYYAFYLTVSGRHDEAIDAARRAFASDPISASLSHTLAVQLALAGRLDQAVRESLRTIELDSDFGFAHQMLASLYSAKGMYEEARAAAERAVALDGGTATSLAILGEVQARSGRRNEALKIVDRLAEASRSRYTPALAFAIIYAGLDDKDQTFAWLEKAYAERFNRLAYLRMDPVWRGLHDDPRFNDLVRRIGLPR